MTKKEVLAKAKAENVRFVRLQFTELHGHLKNIQIPVEELPKALDNQMMFDGSSIRGYKRIEKSDMYFQPDLSTFQVIPWLEGATGNVARIICDVADPDGTPFVGDPRVALKTVIADAKKKGYAKLAILTVSDGFGQAGRGVLQELIPAQGLTLVADEVYGPKDTDMSAQLTKIKSTAPDAIICWGTNPGPAVVARNRAQLGLTTPLYMSHGVASKKFIELAGDAAEGLILPAGRMLASDQVPADNPQTALLTKYVADYTKRFGAAPATFGGHTYDALNLLVTAVKMGKSIKPQDIRDNLEKIKNLPVAGGVYSMSPENHNGLDEDAFFMVTIAKGEWKVVD